MQLQDSISYACARSHPCDPCELASASRRAALLLLALTAAVVPAMSRCLAAGWRGRWGRRPQTVRAPTRPLPGQVLDSSNCPIQASAARPITIGGASATTTTSTTASATTTNPAGSFTIQGCAAWARVRRDVSRPPGGDRANRSLFRPAVGNGHQRRDRARTSTSVEISGKVLLPNGSPAGGGVRGKFYRRRQHGHDKHLDGTFLITNVPRRVRRHFQSVLGTASATQTVTVGTRPDKCRHHHAGR